MNRIDDERVLFYLRHQQRIDEWAALAKEASNVAQDFLRSCESDIGALAAELDPEARIYSSLDEGYPKLFICRGKWFRREDEAPMIGIGLEWLRSSVGFTIPGKCPYTGVWVNYSEAGGSATQGKLSSAFKSKGLIQQNKLQSRIWWPAYRWEVAPGEFWNDLSPYRRQILDSIRFFWTTFAPAIPETHPA